MSTNSSASRENICVVCFKNVEIYSIGSCDHTVCYECSTRMRVLCRRNECAICRQDMPQVIFTCTVRPFSEIQHSTFPLEPDFKILFENSQLQNAFYKLLDHSCSVCPKPPSFKTFQNLYDHMRKQHELYYCDLCIENLKIFTSERRCYTRKELAQHRRKGDTDDRSHRGHPLCEFCDTRYMDNDDLYRHLRRDHLYCHFCDADGHHLYYSSYDYLRDHFRDEHFLCEEGNCLDEKFTPVFRTEIDLRAHKASTHSRGMGKAAAKQARTLELEFTLKPRGRPLDGMRGQRGRVRSGFVDSSSLGEEGAVGGVESPRPSSPQLNPSEFPSLGGANSSTSVMSGSRGLKIHTVGRRGNSGLAVTDDNFPVLGVLGDPVATQATSVRLNINPDRSSGPARGVRTGNVSIHVNHRPSGANNVKITKDDFPALSRSSNSSSQGSSQWVAVSSKKQTQSGPHPPPQQLQQQQQQQQRHKGEDFPSLSSKFNTNLNLKTQEAKPNFVNLRNTSEVKQKPHKTSSVTVPVEDTACTSPKTKTKKKKSKATSSNTVSNEDRPDTAKKKTECKTECKRSELNIEASALQDVEEDETVPPSTARPLPTAEDWFGVSSSSKTKNPPPGFGLLNNNNNNNFSMGGKNPPPGFPANGLTFTNSSGQSYAIPNNFHYIPPSNFDKRNQELVTTVNQILLNQVNMEDFRRVSALYRQDQLSAEEYYSHCMRTMGDVGVAQVFPELLVLLPDISKQQELLQLFQKCMRVKKVKKYKLESCKTCRQVLAIADLRLHERHHAEPEVGPHCNTHAVQH